ncbi:hypothetical protein DesfrDRAFT_1389 [Solidesulfovibrio fructosivorans JJ]]|uniref:Uncharacterized protein n=1 Tax=Solidesulfovibrio fructosivorans JJ] TaxID=596151 RepID=E1JUU0_SOLFR|nr:hypothetical protein [Solidesulfovibrio fructosivorans]EFL51854.1 hypothetical protein DesfrDRAFT_1389 [Solidesulfovibrio fructosivorans JJ]]
MHSPVAPEAIAVLLEQLAKVKGGLDSIKNELDGHAPQEAEALQTAITEAAVNLLFSASELSSGVASGDEKDGQEKSDCAEPPSNKARRLYEEITKKDSELSYLLDDHWHKLRLLVDMLKPKTDDEIDPRTKTVGLLLADVAESFITGVEDFSSPPLYVQLREYAALVEAEAKAETVEAGV